MSYNVLVLDDDLFMRKLIQLFLQRDGHRVFHAANTEDAFRLLGEEQIDIITCDLMMPGIDGLDFLLDIKKNPHHNRIPVIVITASGLTDAIAQAKALGAKHVIEKPFSDEDIRNAIIAVSGSAPG
jgi:CheY-like chemotaxis protein